MNEDLDRWLERLEQLHPKVIDMELGRIRTVATTMGLLRPQAYLFTVAGTNGKGSTCNLLDQSLRSNGFSVGFYSSPHLQRFNERISIAGKPASDEAIVAAFEAIDQARETITLTYFEFATLAAAWLFKQAAVDVWVLEVGMGGRLDAANIWDADIALVTSIDLDHQRWLGPDRAAIGQEKVAIGRAGKPLILGEPNIPAAVMERVAELDAYPLRIEHEFQVVRTASELSIDYVQCRNNAYSGPSSTMRLELSEELSSIHPHNIALCIQALAASELAIDFSAVAKILPQVKISGRHSWLHRNPDVLLDVGHNPHAARWLADKLGAWSYSRVHCVVGMLQDKDIKGTLAELATVVDVWHPVTLPVERGCSGAKLAEALRELDLEVTGDSAQTPAQTLQSLLALSGDQELILVFGSFYTVADVLQQVSDKRL